MSSSALKIRPASRADASALSAYLGFEYYVHRHLDWHTPEDWLDSQPFWLVENNGMLIGVLACPPDPEGIFWVRLFAASPNLGTSQIWDLLFPKVLQMIQAQPEAHLSALALQDWFRSLLIQKGFQHHQDIVVLNWENELPPTRSTPSGLHLRKMTKADVPAVAIVDQKSFESIWRHSAAAIHLALEQSSYATVAELNGEIVGYQLSTGGTLHAHLARLAVIPELQRQNIGFALVYDLFQYAMRENVWQVTVNTQSTNHASLALYQKMGFRLTGEQYPVFKYKVNEI